MARHLISLFIILCSSITLFGQQIDSNKYKFSSGIYDYIKKDSNYWRGGVTSSDLSFIGLYKEAIAEWDKSRQYKPYIPDSVKNNFIENYSTVNARKYIIQKANENQIIIFNEAHYNSRNRVFVASLLKDFKKIGYTYFAAEALNTDSTYQNLKLPLFSTGYYTMEPQFGNLIREAIRQKLKLFAYEDSTGANGKQREINEAKNLELLLKKDPKAKIIIYCGFSHIFEDSVYNWEKAMAGRLKEFTGIDPYTIDQTELIEKSNPDFENPYFKLINENNYCILVNKNKVAFNKKTNRQYVDALLYTPRTKYIYNRPNWIFENSKVPYFINPNVVKLVYPILVKVYLSTDNLKTTIPIDIIEIKSLNELQQTAVAVLEKDNLIIKLTDKLGNHQLINVNQNSR